MNGQRRSAPAAWLLPLTLVASLLPPPLAAAADDKPAAAAPLTAKDRVVFVGDSITDGFTYPLLIEQALAEAGRPVPVALDAGVAGDTAAGMLKRLDRDVFPRRPTLVTLSAGINDVLHGVPDDAYERDVAAVAERLKRERVPLVLLTTTVLGPKHAAADKRLGDYNAILRRVADRYGCRVAEVNKLTGDGRAAGRAVLEDDQVHLTFDGYRLMTRAVLDALGYADVKVPERLKVSPMPGLVRDWRVRPAPADGGPLDDAAAATLKVDEAWKPYPLPDPEPVAHWWMDQERGRGFAVSVERVAGKAKRYQAAATVESDGPRRVLLNPGADVQAIWLNGKRVFQQGPTFTGWHPGHERVAAELTAGKNTIVIETGGTFFLSVTGPDDDSL